MKLGAKKEGKKVLFKSPSKMIKEEIVKLTEELSLYSPESEEYKERTERIKTLSEAANKLDDTKTKIASIIGQAGLDASGMAVDFGAKKMVIDHETNGGCFGGLMEKTIAKKDIRRRGTRIHS